MVKSHHDTIFIFDYCIVMIYGSDSVPVPFEYRTSDFRLRTGRTPSAVAVLLVVRLPEEATYHTLASAVDELK